MPYIQTTDTKLYYEEHGNQSDPVILMIMGLASQLIAWPPEMVNHLTKAGYRVICFDNRDTGLSSKLGNTVPNIIHHIIAYRLHLPLRAPYTLYDMAQDTLELMDALQIDTAHLIGASMGGMIAQILAAKHPERVLSLTTMMATSGYRRLPMPKPKVIRRLLSRNKMKTREGYIRNSMKTFRMIESPKYPSTEAEIRAYVEASYDRGHYPKGHARQLAAILACGDRTPLLKKIQCPTLVIHGKEDVLSPVQGGIHTALKTPNAKLELVEGMGHNFPKQLISILCRKMLQNIEEGSNVEASSAK